MNEAAEPKAQFLACRNWFWIRFPIMKTFDPPSNSGTTKEPMVGMKTSITLLVFCFLYAPIAVLIIFSFNDSKLNAAWRGFTLAWYGRLFANESVLGAFKNTMIVAVASTVISTAIGTITAYGLNRFHVRMRGFFDSLIYMPIIMPEIIMGISLLAFLVLIGVRLGLSTIIIGHVVFNISFVTVVVSARLADMDRRIEEAAMDLGAPHDQARGFGGRASGIHAFLRRFRRDFLHIRRWRNHASPEDILHDKIRRQPRDQRHIHPRHSGIDHSRVRVAENRKGKMSDGNGKRGMDRRTTGEP